jgi:hypothetical protein
MTKEGASMYSNDDLRPVPTFLRNSDEDASETIMEKRLYKPSQYQLTSEKRLLSFNKEESSNQ